MKQSDLAAVGRVGWYCASVPSKAHSCPLVASPDGASCGPQAPGAGGEAGPL